MKKDTLLKRMIVCSIIALPVIAYIITQFALGYVTKHNITFNVVVLIVVGIIFAFNIPPRKAFIRNVNKKFEVEGRGIVPIEGGAEYVHVKDRVNVNLTEMKKRPKLVRFISIILGIVMLGLSFAMYYFFNKKIRDANAELVDAKVVSVADLTTVEVSKDEKGTTTSITSACEVTFSYILNGEQHEVKHIFKQIETFKADELKIYVADGNFVATARMPICGIVFAVYYLLLAILHFARAFYAIDVATTLVGGLFSSLAGLFIQELQVSFIQIFFLMAGSVMVLLTICGIGMLLSNISSINIYSRTTTKLSASVSSK